jgi:hypothetical protein
MITATGTLTPQKQALLRFRQDASNIRILVEPGIKVQAGEILVSSDTIRQTYTLQEAKSELARAEARYDSLLREKFREVRQSEKDAAFERIEAAQARVDLAEDNLAAASILAPFDGSVIEIYPNPFENVSASEPVVLFADLETLQIETDDLDEKDTGRLALGDSAEIFFDALPDVVIKGEILRISEIVQEGAGNDFNVVISPLEIPEGLRWGMSAYVVIQPGSSLSLASDQPASENLQPSAAEMPAIEAEPTQTRLCDNAYFVNETVPDGSVFSPGARFIKTWSFRNTGTCTWRPDYHLVFVSGDQLDGPDMITLGRYVAPGARVTIELELIAPDEEGSFFGAWQLQNELKQRLYDIWVDITVTR